MIPAGPSRMALEDFVQQKGWGLILIHAACAFVTGWPFMENACVQQYYTHNGSGTVRRMFKDSGITADPNHGVNNPYSDFLLRGPLPGWGLADSFRMADEWWSFRAAARNTSGVNILFGFDELSAPECGTSSCMGNANHNMVWTRMMGEGITVTNTWGHDLTMYSGYGNFGDTLLWRFIRYAAKDWENPVSGLRETGSAGQGISMSAFSGMLAVTLTRPGPHRIQVADVRGKNVFATPVSGPGRFEMPGLGSGIRFVRVTSREETLVQKVVMED
jgi:hypothetical protein